jgi:pyruvate dehydrogenase E1 component
MTTVRAIDTAAAAGSDYDPLGEVAAQVLWLSTAMVHHANRVRPNPTGLKVGGHQASSASDVSIMTSLYFEHLRSGDRVSPCDLPQVSPNLQINNSFRHQTRGGHQPRATPHPFSSDDSWPPQAYAALCE